jgi:hypothetical protein
VTLSLVPLCVCVCVSPTTEVIVGFPAGRVRRGGTRPSLFSRLYGSGRLVKHRDGVAFSAKTLCLAVTSAIGVLALWLLATDRLDLADFGSSASFLGAGPTKAVPFTTFEAADPSQLLSIMTPVYPDKAELALLRNQIRTFARYFDANSIQ